MIINQESIFTKDSTQLTVHAFSLLKISIRNIWVTPTALASGAGYQTKNTSAIKNSAIAIEMVKWPKKNFIRFDIFICDQNDATEF